MAPRWTPSSPFVNPTAANRPAGWPVVYRQPSGREVASGASRLDLRGRRCTCPKPWQSHSGILERASSIARIEMESRFYARNRNDPGEQDEACYECSRLAYPPKWLCNKATCSRRSTDMGGSKRIYILGYPDWESQDSDRTSQLCRHEFRLAASHHQHHAALPAWDVIPRLQARPWNISRKLMRSSAIRP